MLIFSDKLIRPKIEHVQFCWSTPRRSIMGSKRKLKNSELERLDVTEFKAAEKTPLIVVLDNIRSLNNIGSIFRSADAFLIQKVYLCGITATPPHKDIHKTALGATESVAWEYRENAEILLEELSAEHYCLAVEQTEESVPLQEFIPEPQQSYVLVFGNEVKGVSQSVVDRCHKSLEIPQFGTKHSLNVAVSAGVVLWDFWSKLSQTL